MDFLKRYTSSLAVFVLAVFFSIGYFLTFAPPRDFPATSVVGIARGASVSDITKELGDARVIQHPRLLQAVLRLSGTSERVQAGAYLFNTPQNLFTVAYRLVTGSYGLPPVRLTFPEGTTVRDVAALVAEAFPDISAEGFMEAGRPYEGYLFPDTYLFLPSADAGAIIAAMRENFNAKISSSAPAIAASGHSLSDIVVMASLVEREVRSIENKRIVAGILWDRLALGMPLQVDAVFGYIFDRDTYSPSLADLKVDSPYNTYTHTGLPPGPIANPGLESIDAALHPTKTNYLYYLTGTDGLMHYAATYAAHQSNRAKYLK